MTKQTYCVTKLEVGARLSGSTLERPIRSRSKHKSVLALMREIERISKNADSVAVTVEVYGYGHDG